MTLGELLSRLEHTLPLSPSGSALPTAIRDRRVEGVAYDSRRVTPGDVFVALPGQRFDGAAFAPEAVERGAIAVVAQTESPCEVTSPWLVVSDARLALAVLAAAVFGDPSHEMLVVGITGTNGKTTTSCLVQAMFQKAGVSCGRAGTVGQGFGNVERASPRTTPEAADLQALLRDMVDDGCRASVIEVSSHALSLRRVDELKFGAAVFTNLSRDHLDFHTDMESYFLAKRRLFEMLEDDAFGIINLDDPHGEELVGCVPRSVTFAVDRAADVTPADVTVSLDGVTFDVHTPRGLLHARSRLLGHVTVYNVLAAVTTCMALDLPFAAIEQGIFAVERVPGRCELASSRSDDVTVVVDYAHTDDALRRLLQTLRLLTSGRLITVFGCGGDRDRTKRPLMGAVAARLSDRIVVTSDNPRSEDPTAIIAEIMRGVSGEIEASVPLTVEDRGTAIRRAVADAHAGDLVVIAGKGHEKQQEVGDRVLRFDDVEVARDALALRRANSHV